MQSVRRLFLLLACLACSSAAMAAPRVILVPMGFNDKTMLRDLAATFKTRYGVEVRVAQPIALDQGSYRASQQSYEIESLISYVQAKTGSLRKGGNLAIGITSSQLHSGSSKQWPFIFSGAVEPDVGLLSTAHMDPTYEGKPADRKLYLARTRKMLYKVLGRLYWHKNVSKDPHSPMFSPHTVKELDAMKEAS